MYAALLMMPLPPPATTAIGAVAGRVGNNTFSCGTHNNRYDKRDLQRVVLCGPERVRMTASCYLKSDGPLDA
jgi:hypothetical protein